MPPPYPPGWGWEPDQVFQESGCSAPLVWEDIRGQAATPPTSPIFSPLGVAHPPKAGPAREAPPHLPLVQASCLSLHIFPLDLP